MTGEFNTGVTYSRNSKDLFVESPFYAYINFDGHKRYDRFTNTLFVEPADDRFTNTLFVEPADKLISYSLTRDAARQKSYYVVTSTRRM